MRADGGIFHGWRVVAVCFVIAAFAWGLGLFGSSVYLQAVTTAHRWAVAEVASAITLFFLVSAAVQRLVGRSIDRWGPRPVLAIGTRLDRHRRRADRPGERAMAALSLLRAGRDRLVGAVDDRDLRDRGALVRAPPGPVDHARHHGCERRRHCRRAAAAGGPRAVRPRRRAGDGRARGRGRASAADRLGAAVPRAGRPRPAARRRCAAGGCRDAARPSARRHARQPARPAVERGRGLRARPHCADRLHHPSPGPRRAARWAPPAPAC